MEYSKGTILVWRMAADEALCRQNEFIEREHIFMALCKVHTLLDLEFHEGINARLPLSQLQTEVEPLLSVFSALGLSQETSRRKVSDLLVDGEGRGQEQYVIHRSDDCKRLFDHAERIARERNSHQLMPIHLLAAVLVEPTEFISEALAGSNISEGELAEVLESVQCNEREEGESSRTRYTAFGDL